MNAFARIAHSTDAQADRARPAFRPHRPADRGERLARALRADAARAGCAITLSVQTVEPWSSGIFSGAVITLSLDGSACPALAIWLAELRERDIPLGRDIVADLTVERVDHGWWVRALLCLDAANG